jgi:fructose-bisphosphate aldolase class II
MAAKRTLYGRELSDTDLEAIRAEVESFDTIEHIDDEMRDLIANQWPQFARNGGRARRAEKFPRTPQTNNEALSAIAIPPALSTHEHRNGGRTMSTITMQGLRKLLEQTEKNRVAIGHFNVADSVLLKAVFTSAQELKVPVLVGASEGEREFMGSGQIAALVRSLREEFDFPIFLNADHTHSLPKALEAARAGFDAIVFDLSALPFEQNVRGTREAVEAIKAVNSAILVEGEIGDIGTGSEIHDAAPDLSKGLTTPVEAKQYVESTGIDVLAPAVGNMHGMLKSMVHGQTRKRLDIPRIAQIKSATGVPLTLHGGSGTGDEDLRKAIAAGINIIHINTELRVAWRRGLEDGLAKQPNEVVPYKILPFVVESVKKVARSRLRLFNGAV